MTTGDIRFQGRLEKWTEALITGRLSTDRLILHDVPLEHWTAEFEQRNQTLRLRVPIALVADGRLAKLGEYCLGAVRATAAVYAKLLAVGLI